MTQRFDTDPATGLTDEQVRQRIKAGQVNRQIKTVSKSVLGIIRDNVFTFFNLINIVLAALIIMVDSYKNLFFLGIVFFNTIIGIIQELRAKITLDRLSLISATKAETMRAGVLNKLNIADIVLDDIMILSAGNQICADAIVREGSIEVNESLLTGESDTVLKTPGDTLYSGSFVVSGKALVQVEHVGQDNFANQITAQAKAYKKHPSELRSAMNRILKIISIIIVPLGVGLFLSQYYAIGISMPDTVVGTVAAVLGMIPEGLVLLISVALAVGVINLGRRKTLVQELYCIETLARVDILCLDKTGTLTEGNMRVTDVKLLANTSVDEIMGNMIRVIQDENSTFLALKDHFADHSSFKNIDTIPFSSARKYSGASFEGQGTYIIGAFEFVFGDQYPEIHEQVEQYTKDGIRVIVLANSKLLNAGTDLPAELVPLALILINDIVRADAQQTLAYFAEQGVKLMVISGDHPATVAHIAAQAGLPDADKFIDASTLKTEADLIAAVQIYSIFGRVSPVQKRQIIAALKAAGHTVAMTGDGVNDVPALKEADCSIAMAQGSAAAKHISNLVLLDSNFASMPFIVKEGRRVINNIQSSASLFLVKTIFSIVLTVLMLILGTSYPFMPVHLTVISIFAVGIPTFILSMEPNFNRVKAGFLLNVMNNALIGAITIIMNILIITIASMIFSLSDEARTTMCMITTGIASLYMIKQVFPLQSILRKVVYYSMFGLFLFGMLFAQSFLELVELHYTQTILVIILIIAIPVQISTIGAFLEKHPIQRIAFAIQKIAKRFLGVKSEKH